MSEKVVAYLTRQSILASICILLSLFCCPVFPEALPTTTSSLSNDALLPVKPMKWENADKLERARVQAGRPLAAQVGLRVDLEPPPVPPDRRPDRQGALPT